MIVLLFFSLYLIIDETVKLLLFNDNIFVLTCLYQIAINVTYYRIIVNLSKCHFI